MIIVDKETIPLSIDYREGALMLVDKPLEWTSFDVVNKIRFTLKHHYNIKKLKVGHAGTLDPLATGLLLICTGKYTKRIIEFQEMAKSYLANVKLGATTISYDAEHPEENKVSIDHLKEEQIHQVLKQFVGKIEQYPPIFSALKVDGKALYKYARKGIKKEIKSREITIHKIDVQSIHFPVVDLIVNCSKGTYIRSLAHDIGQNLDVGAYLSGLCRLSIGEFKNENACNLEVWVSQMKSEEKE